MRRMSAASRRYTPAFTVSVVIVSVAAGFSRKRARRESASSSTRPYWRGSVTRVRKIVARGAGRGGGGGRGGRGGWGGARPGWGGGGGGGRGRPPGPPAKTPAGAGRSPATTVPATRPRPR